MPRPIVLSPMDPVIIQDILNLLEARDFSVAPIEKGTWMEHCNVEVSLKAGPFVKPAKDVQLRVRRAVRCVVDGTESVGYLDRMKMIENLEPGESVQVGVEFPPFKGEAVVANHLVCVFDAVINADHKYYDPRSENDGVWCIVYDSTPEGRETPTLGQPARGVGAGAA